MHRSKTPHKESKSLYHDDHHAPHDLLLKEDPNAYRHRLYTRLRRKCESDTACFELIGPISQKIDKRNDKFGHCHGYGEVLTSHLSQGTAKQFFAERPAWDWDTLAGTDAYELDFFPITDEIHEKQQHQQRFLGFVEHWHATAYHDKNELIEALIQKTVIKDAFEVGKLYVIDIGTIPPRNLSPSRIFLEIAPTFKQYWHEIRLYVDETQRVCLLDANVGLFQSREPKPSVEALQAGLEGIFKAVNYSEYRILDIPRTLTIDFPLEKSLRDAWLL